jgi:hypothetical protein
LQSNYYSPECKQRRHQSFRANLAKKKSGWKFGSNIWTRTHVSKSGKPEMVYNIHKGNGDADLILAICQVEVPLQTSNSSVSYDVQLYMTFETRSLSSSRTDIYSVLPVNCEQRHFQQKKWLTRKLRKYSRVNVGSIVQSSLKTAFLSSSLSTRLSWEASDKLDVCRSAILVGRLFLRSIPASH